MGPDFIESGVPSQLSWIQMEIGLNLTKVFLCIWLVIKCWTDVRLVADLDQDELSSCVQLSIRIVSKIEDKYLK
jgi:hypothetical protein